MKILLLGDYSNVHATLARGLRQLGHAVTVASDGDSWKDYERDVDLSRRSLSTLDTLLYIAKLAKAFAGFRGYDVVQLINPIFIDLRANMIRPFYEYLRRNNKHVFLGAFGMDYYWVKTCLDCKTFRYSDFNFGSHPRTEEPFNQVFIRDWLDGEKTPISKYVAHDCDGIISGLYEYDCCYRPEFGDKVRYIPFPIPLDDEPCHIPDTHEGPVRFFVGISRNRSAYKGTDVMLRALERVKAEYPEQTQIIKAEGVPFAEYVRMMESADVILDQLYSYTPAMNALQAMAKGLVVVGGGEPENYEILNENELRPIINVLPNEDDCYLKMRDLVLNPSRIPQLKRDSIEYIRRHHEYVKVAQRYLDFWNERMQGS